MKYSHDLGSTAEAAVQWMGIGKFSSVHRENRENAACLNVNGGQAKLNWNWNDNANPNYGSASRGCVIF